MALEKNFSTQVRTENIDQDEVIERLKYAFSYDILNIDEFENRLEKAAATRNTAALQALISDLPRQPPQAVPATPPQPGSSKSIKENGFSFSIMGGITKKGRWKPPRNLNAVAVMGGLKLDFTKVQLPPGVTSIRIINLMGGTEIIIPPGVNVDANGFAIMGGFEDHSHQDNVYPGAPTLKIRGVAIMGGIEIRAPKQKLIDRILKKLHLD